MAWTLTTLPLPLPLHNGLKHNPKIQAVYYSAKLVMVITYANVVLPYRRQVTGPIFSLPYTWREFL